MDWFRRLWKESTLYPQPLKGPFEKRQVAASLKRYPDTNLAFFRSLLGDGLV
jgi:hypothetical protein